MVGEIMEAQEKAERKIWQKFLASANQADLLRSVVTVNYDDVNMEHPLTQKILTDGTVDKAVVLAFYWRNAPRYKKQYDSIDDVPEWNRENYRLIQQIEEQYLNGFYTVSNIFYDPKSDYGEDFTKDYLEHDPHGKLPKRMEEALEGEFVEEDAHDVFEDGLPFDLAEEIFNLY